MALNASGCNRITTPAITAKIVLTRTAPAAASFEIFPYSVFSVDARFTAFSIAVLKSSPAITVPDAIMRIAHSALERVNQSLKIKIENMYVRHVR